ncbi:putative Rpc11-DNA-directed RNA polymerase III subunit C11 [Meira miltonrushii]|uniref:DNA-directed RNA polymerase subunit n=1 Tax=Meira miltonrushii TaxID=1280837 RepID=A0A316VJ65_9BASI|nr:putative Rpc11-DNA-directed RNA polymerase III subunit C11 [Meira miltonrushii]PWN37540.1 putative Rpc11-DNA-directed RNA polymerase III subunit C11 [Meira miltonrushii]
MSLFCPTCANMLLVGRDDMNRNRWECSTCPYQFPIAKQMTTRVKLTRKQVDDIMGGEDAWKNVDSTDAACPKCDNARAFFMQLQIRSADEPMTTFYRCTKSECGYQWREG